MEIYRRLASMTQIAGSLLDETRALGVDSLTGEQKIGAIIVLLRDIRDRLTGVGLSGNGPPDSVLGLPGSTYVDLESNGFYWKGTDGWRPQ